MDQSRTPDGIQARPSAPPPLGAGGAFQARPPDADRSHDRRRPRSVAHRSDALTPAAVIGFMKASAFVAVVLGAGVGGALAWLLTSPPNDLNAIPGGIVLGIVAALGLLLVSWAVMAGVYAMTQTIEGVVSTVDGGRPAGKVPPPKGLE